jgi:hypothetical protein
VVGVSFEQLRSVGTGEIEIEKEEQSRHRIKKLQVIIMKVKRIFKEITELHSTFISLTFNFKVPDSRPFHLPLGN